jgi:hypothetical protein
MNTTDYKTISIDILKLVTKYKNEIDHSEKYKLVLDELNDFNEMFTVFDDNHAIMGCMLYTLHNYGIEKVRIQFNEFLILYQNPECYYCEYFDHDVWYIDVLDNEAIGPAGMEYSDHLLIDGILKYVIPI